ncbi:MAG: histone deacetylase family protein, partial [Rhodospirillaceae bacterium]|nr:histone deacetylase family protein [Rhodospirillaceae bacterium]
TWVTRELRAIAEDCCDGRLVSSLEGGYNLDALALSTAAHVRVLLES